MPRVVYDDVEFARVLDDVGESVRDALVAVDIHRELFDGWILEIPDTLDFTRRRINFTALGCERFTAAMTINQEKWGQKTTTKSSG